MTRAASHLKKLELIVDPTDTRPLVQANTDDLNPGVFDSTGARLPPSYNMQVDDCLYADIPRFFPRTAAASLIALDDIFDNHHPYQEPPLSIEKLNPCHSEQRTLLGYNIDTRSMTVQLSPRRREKILAYLTEERWLLPGKHATLKHIATVTGIIASAATYFPWGRAQLLVLYSLLHDHIASSYHALQRTTGIKRRLAHAHRVMPKELSFRLSHLSSQYHAQYIWDNKMSITIPDAVRKSLQTLYKYIHSRQPWEQPIGHIVPRTPTFVATSDASTKAIGVHIPTIRAWCLIPFGPELSNRVDTGDVHINALEFIALLITYIMVQEKIETQREPGQIPPHTHPRLTRRQHVG